VAALVRCLLAAWVSALLGAVLGYNYVGAQFFSLLVPGLVGAVVAVAGRRAAGGGLSGPELLGSRLVTAGYATVSALYAFRFADEPYGPTGRWLPPVVCALVGAVVGEMNAAPPRRGPMVRG
jgi:hypothetical protein